MIILMFLLLLVENDYCRGKVTVCCCHGYHLVVQIYEDADDPNVSVDVVMVTVLLLINRQ